MANRVQRRARQELRELPWQQARQQFKTHKQSQRKNDFHVLFRQCLIDARFDLRYLPTSICSEEVISICRIFRHFLKVAELSNYHPLYPSPLALLAELLHHPKRKELCLDQSEALRFWLKNGKPVRRIHHWKAPRTKNSFELLWSFIKHTYVHYPNQLPNYFRKFFYAYCQLRYNTSNPYFRLGLQLLLHLAQGHGLHRFSRFEDYKIPGKANLFLIETPYWVTNYNELISWVTLRAWGIDAPMAKLLDESLSWCPRFFFRHGRPVLQYLATHQHQAGINWARFFYLIDQLVGYIERRFYHQVDDYYYSVMRFFLLHHEVIETEEWLPWLEYITTQREAGTTLKMKGRSVTAFRRKFQEYAQRNLIELKKQSWEGFAYAPYEEKGTEAHFRIVQLTSEFDLFVEGHRMHHCVYSYAESCLNGSTSIWSLQFQRARKPWESLVTIEVSDEGYVVQAYARCNLTPHKIWKEKIKLWADREGIVYKQH